MKILFVDDEKNVLNGLKRMLHTMKNEWVMYFEESAQKALAVMEKEEIDLIVTDIKMPGMDGISLLEEVMEKFPGVVRIILTGHMEEESIINSVKTSHQFILKPCSWDELVNRIKKIFSLKKYLVAPQLKSVLSQVERIPALPENYLRLERELNSKEPSMLKICSIIEKEPALSAKILQIVNSAYFNLPATVFEIQQALNILGINSIRSIVLYSEIFQKTPPLKTNLFTVDSLWKHSIYVANAAKIFYETITKDKFIAKHAYIAGLLHDIGYLLTSQIDGYDENIIKLQNEHKCERFEAERRFIQITHAEIGAYLLSVWNLPVPIIKAVANHHTSIYKAENPDFEDAIYFAQLWERDQIMFEEILTGLLEEPAYIELKEKLEKLTTNLLV